MKKILTISITLAMMACNQIPRQETAQTLEEKDFVIATWVSNNRNKSDADWMAEFTKYRENGIDEVLVIVNDSVELLRQITPLATKASLNLHAWFMTVNRPGDKVAGQHPEWYQVSRNGKSCFDEPPYVGYYKWLCPTRKESREHILSIVRQLSEVPDIASVHLDYIRYCDIFLPVGLLPKYDLVQNKELPEYDFCYCDACIEAFEKQHKRNPKELEHPELDIEWKQFRLNQVRKLVNEAYEIAHGNRKKLTAAVFPYPEMAGNMVRQRWDKWKIDATYPMLYNGFYLEDIDWIAFGTAQGVQDVEGKFDIHTGVFMPDLTGADLEKVIRLAKENGAVGISLFSGESIKDEHYEVLRKHKNKSYE